MEGRIKSGLTLSVEENPKFDTMYVFLSKAVNGESPPNDGGAYTKIIECLRSRNYTDDQHKFLSYWELCKTTHGIVLMYQGQRHKHLSDAKSNLATSPKHIGSDTALAHGLKYLDFQGLMPGWADTWLTHGPCWLTHGPCKLTHGPAGLTHG